MILHNINLEITEFFILVDIKQPLHYLNYVPAKR